MNLLSGIPKRVPVLYMTYSMPRDYYDPTDRKEHLQLVIGLDPARKVAFTASRTTAAHVNSPRRVPHPADPDLGMMVFGWWLVDNPHSVPYSVFGDDDVRPLGLVDSVTQRRLEETLGAAETDAVAPDEIGGETV